MCRGGFICQTYGSSMGGLVDAVQMEVPSEIRWHVTRTYGCWTLKPLTCISVDTFPLASSSDPTHNQFTWAFQGGPLLYHIHARTTLANSWGIRGGQGRLLGRGKHRPKSDLTRISCPIRRTFHPVKVWAFRIWTWIFLVAVLKNKFEKKFWRKTNPVRCEEEFSFFHKDGTEEI